MKKFLMTLLCSMLLVAAYAQSFNIMNIVRTELAKRGLEETEVRTRLLENGIDVDSIKPSEYANYRSQVMGILDQMQAEKNGTAQADTTGNSRELLNRNYREIGYNQTAVNPPLPPQQGNNTKVELFDRNGQPIQIYDKNGKLIPSDSLSYYLDNAPWNKEIVDSNAIYGHSILKGKALDIFKGTDGAQAPDSYVLGDGDEVHISIFGSSQTEIHQRIGLDGSIQPTGSSKIFLKGLTLAQAREAIRNKLSQHFSFNKDQIAVTINTARTVSVSIYGEVKKQGGYSLSALNTAFNAMAAAGGPSDLGSVRNIQLSRAGKTLRLDLYEYMMNPGKTVYDLQNGDIFFVPIAQKVVKVEGAVNRPMRYEMVEGEDLQKLISLAGGLKPDAYMRFVQVERYADGEKQFLEYDLNQVMSGAKRVDLVPGDIVRVKASTQPMENFVAIDGEVYFGGNYDLYRNSSLKTLIENAKPKYSARTDFVFVERFKPDSTSEVITVPFPGTNGNADYRLQKRDKVTVLAQTSYRDLDTIRVNGQVRAPFEKVFGLHDKMTVAQAIEYAGGVKTNGYPIAYIFRKDVSNPEKMQYKRVSLKTDGNMFLQPGDQLNVYDNSTYTEIGQVSISGAVNEPFKTGYDPSLNLHDLIEMAGGLSVSADRSRVEVFRVVFEGTSKTELKLLSLSVDSNFNPTTSFQIQPYDQIVIRQIPDFTLGRTVEINGRVKYPGVYVLSDHKTHLSEIIEKAGGLLDDNSPYAILTRNYNNRGAIGVNVKDVMKNKRKEKIDPILMEDDVINIVRQENTVTIYETGTRMSQYTPEEFQMSKKTIVFQGRHSAGWYIKHYAGGFHKLADKNSVTVTMPNYQTRSTSKFLFFRNYPTVEPGSVITLSYDDKKVEQLDKPKEKFDWENFATKTLSTVTSVVSIILLLNRL